MEKTDPNFKPLQPKNDIVFHSLFERGKENITKAMLEAILKIKIEKLDLDVDSDLSKNYTENKNGRLDLRAIINKNIECDIEIQLVSHEKIMERFLYYWSMMYVANLKVGDKYDKLRKTISIIIVDGEIPELKEMTKSHTKWHIREDEYTEKILTNYLEINIIELPKAIKEYKKNPEDSILQWMMFLENPEDSEVMKIMSKNKEIKEAREELDEISKNDILRRMALKADLAKRDQEELLYEAKRDGEEIGINKRNIEIAKSMLSRNIDIQTISEITGLTKKEIEKLK